jgi:hypothetical protein
MAIARSKACGATAVTIAPWTPPISCCSTCGAFPIAAVDGEFRASFFARRSFSSATSTAATR